MGRLIPFKIMTPARGLAGAVTSLSCNSGSAPAAFLRLLTAEINLLVTYVSRMASSMFDAQAMTWSREQ